MSTRIYVRVEGERERLANVQESLEGVVTGEVRARRYVGAPPPNFRPFYWASNSIDLSSDDANGQIKDVLKSIVQGVVALSDLQFSLVIVIEHSEEDPPTGFYLDPGIIELARLLKADLDVDIISKISQ